MKYLKLTICFFLISIPVLSFGETVLVNKNNNQKYALTDLTNPPINVNQEYILVDNNIPKILSSHGMGCEYLTDYIETHTVDVPFVKSPKWYKDCDRCTITDSESYSGNKSIKFDYARTYNSGETEGDGTGSCWTTFDFGKRIKEMYFSTYIKFVKNDSVANFQWKGPRINSSNAYVVGGSAADWRSAIISDVWWKAANGWHNNPIQLFSAGDRIAGTKMNLQPDAFLFDEWQRIEIYYKRNLIVNNQMQDAVVEWHRVGRPGGSLITIDNSTIDLITHTEKLQTPPIAYWRYLLVGIYYGNLKDEDGENFVGQADMKVYYDDIYINDSRARLELGNSDTWVNCTKREIQKVVSWPRLGNDRTITFKFYKGGSFTTGDAWLYYVNHDGNPTLLGKVNLQ